MTTDTPTAAASDLDVDVATPLQITQFLYTEAQILDEGRFADWLTLVTEDISYRMPVRVTREKRDGSDTRDDSSYFEENLTTLTSRLARLGTRSAWAEDPPSRTRHFVTNIQVLATADPRETRVLSNLLFTRTRGSDPALDQLTGRREDLLRRVGLGWRLARRTVVLDQSVLGTLNLSTMY